MTKYKVDEWVLFCTFPEETGSILSQERKRSVILEVLSKNDFYDYRIYIDETAKIKKVREHQLFVARPPTY